MKIETHRKIEELQLALRIVGFYFELKDLDLILNIIKYVSSHQKTTILDIKMIQTKIEILYHDPETELDND